MSVVVEDVYKRQLEYRVHNVRRDERGAKHHHRQHHRGTQRRYVPFPATPVSYTHLDVYKRQGAGSGNGGIEQGQYHFFLVPANVHTGAQQVLYIKRGFQVFVYVKPVSRHFKSPPLPSLPCLSLIHI